MTFLDHHVVAAFYPVKAKSEALKGANNLPAIQSREA
jgi:hypothetical protein